MREGSSKRNSLFDAEFFDKPDDEFRGVGEEVVERLDVVNIEMFIFVKLQTGAAGVVIEIALDIIPGVFAAALRSARIYRAKADFEQRAGAAIGLDELRTAAIGHKQIEADNFCLFGCYNGRADDFTAFGAFFLEADEANGAGRGLETIQAVLPCL